MRVLRVKATCFAHATEEVEKVKQALINIFPTEVEVRQSQARGQFGNPIIILEAEVKKQPEIRAFLKRLIESLPSGDIERLRSEIERRFEEGRFYIRLDKMHAYSGRLRLGQGLQVVLVVTSYPYDEGRIKQGLKKLLGG
ncbi:RNA-binding domain-containing protein [Candidatus Pyrohabitans sp.]